MSTTLHDEIAAALAQYSSNALSPIGNLAALLRRADDALREAQKERDKIIQDYDYLLANTSEAEWRRIEALSPEQVNAELIADGYTQDEINAMVARGMAVANKHRAAIDSAPAKEDHP